MNNKNITSAPISPDIYFEEIEEETNKVTLTSVKTNDNNMYFEELEEEMNEVNIDNNSDLNCDNNSEEELSKKSNDNSDSDEFIDSNYPIYNILLCKKMA